MAGRGIIGIGSNSGETFRIALTAMHHTVSVMPDGITTLTNLVQHELRHLFADAYPPGTRYPGTRVPRVAQRRKK